MHGPVVRIVRCDPVRQLVQVRLADDDRPGFFEARHHRRVVRGNKVGEYLCSTGRANAGRIKQVLHRDGDTMQRAAILPCPGLLVQRPGTFQPIADMVGGGPFNLRPGEWTDDTSMALCLASSLVECNGFDPRDQVERYCRWAREGYMSSTGNCFDIGNTVRAALAGYEATGDPFSGLLSVASAGNGSIMRLAPVAMYYFPDRHAIEYYAGESSRTTHGTQECVEACRLLGGVLGRALSGQSKEEVLAGANSTFQAPALGPSHVGSIGTRAPPRSAVEAMWWPPWRQRSGVSIARTVLSRQSFPRQISVTTPTQRLRYAARSQGPTIEPQAYRHAGLRA